MCWHFWQKHILANVKLLIKLVAFCVASVLSPVYHLLRTVMLEHILRPQRTLLTLGSRGPLQEGGVREVSKKNVLAHPFLLLLRPAPAFHSHYFHRVYLYN